MVSSDHCGDDLERRAPPPLIQALGLAFCVFGVALGAFTDKENLLPVYGLILSALLPLPVAVGVILLGML